MYVDDQGVTIEYPSGNNKKIPRSMIMKAIRVLRSKGVLTLDDVHYKITNENGPQTDRLMAVLRELPGVTFDREAKSAVFEMTAREIMDGRRDREIP